MPLFYLNLVNARLLYRAGLKTLARVGFEQLFNDFWDSLTPKKKEV